jgi:hypothetical protein
METDYSLLSSRPVCSIQLNCWRGMEPSRPGPEFLLVLLPCFLLCLFRRHFRVRLQGGGCRCRFRQVSLTPASSFFEDLAARSRRRSRNGWLRTSDTWNRFRIQLGIAAGRRNRQDMQAGTRVYASSPQCAVPVLVQNRVSPTICP